MNVNEYEYIIIVCCFMYNDDSTYIVVVTTYSGPEKEKLDIAILTITILLLENNFEFQILHFYTSTLVGN